MDCKRFLRSVLDNAYLYVLPLTFMLVAALTACGGGGGYAGSSPFYGGSTSGTTSGGSGSGSGSTSGSHTNSTVGIAVTLSNPVVTPTAPVTVTAGVTNASGSPVNAVAVSFFTTQGLAVLNPSSAATDATGKASVQMQAASGAAGADFVNAVVSVNGINYSTTQDFDVTH